MRPIKTAVVGLVVLVALLLLNADARSQNQYRFAAKGQFEVGGSISFQSLTAVNNGKTSDKAAQTFAGAIFFGYFITDGFELGLNPFSWTTVSYGDESATQFTFLFAPSYNFQTNGVVFPFVEGLIGFGVMSNGTVRGGLSWGGRGGIKIAVIEHANIVIGLQYLQATRNTSGAGERSGYDAIEGSIGFSIWF